MHILVPINPIINQVQVVIHPSPLFAPQVQTKSVSHLTEVDAHFRNVNTRIHAQNATDHTPHQPVKNCEPELYSLGLSLVKVDKLSHLLSKYPDKNNANLLLHGFTSGFHLNYHGPRLPMYARDLKSVLTAPEAVRDQIKKELDKGRIAGPFVSPPLPTLRVSPLGLVPKKSGGYRVIHHLSFPDKNSVNHFTDPDICSVSYSSIDDAIELIHKIGKGALLGKMDLKSAFRLLPIWPGDFDLLGFSMDGLYYYDKCLPFGASISCSLFEKFSTFLQWALENEKSFDKFHPSVLHYIDDFLFLGSKDTTQCADTMLTFTNLCATLNIPIATDKTEGPSTTITFLGIEFDTIQMVLRLPAEKILELKEKIITAIHAKKLTLRQLQSIIGLLNFACRVISPGRAFCRRLINATIGVNKAYFKIRVTKSMKADLNVWLEFLRSFNGVTVIPDRFWLTNIDLDLFTDSAGSSNLGFGIYFQGHWCHGSWPQQWAESTVLRNMAFIELFPVLTALFIWGPQLSNKKVLFHVDNQATVQVLNKKSSRDPLIMKAIRKIVLKTLEFNINVNGIFIPSASNGISDSISRRQWTRFRRLAPEADPIPTPIPPEVWRI